MTVLTRKSLSGPMASIVGSIRSGWTKSTLSQKLRPAHSLRLLPPLEAADAETRRSSHVKITQLDWTHLTLVKSEASCPQRFSKTTRIRGSRTTRLSSRKHLSRWTVQGMAKRTCFPKPIRIVSRPKNHRWSTGEASQTTKAIADPSKICKDRKVIPSVQLGKSRLSSTSMKRRLETIQGNLDAPRSSIGSLSHLSHREEFRETLAARTQYRSIPTRR